MRDSGLDINEAPHICTYNLAKRILKRDKRVKLSDVLNEAGFCSVLEHNAYTDALETIYALSFLLKQEED
jgi:DNA polymerase III epsilon subunit-like protein